MGHVQSLDRIEFFPESGFRIRKPRSEISGSSQTRSNAHSDNVPKNQPSGDYL